MHRNSFRLCLTKTGPFLHWTECNNLYKLVLLGLFLGKLLHSIIQHFTNNYAQKLILLRFMTNIFTLNYMQQFAQISSASFKARS